MANFNTHVFYAAASASVTSSICVKLVGLSVSEAILLTTAGIVGGILPDIDLKHSVPSKALFSIIGIVLAVAWLFSQVAKFSVAELWLVAAGIFVFVRFVLWWLFHQFTRHRGSWHSLVAALLVCFASAAGSHQLLGLDPALSWTMALFVAAGYVLHLALDEIYSVDFTGVRIKRSFGSALKILDSTQLLATCLALFATLLVWFWTPPFSPLVAQWSELEVDWPALLLPAYMQ